MTIKRPRHGGVIGSEAQTTTVLVPEQVTFKISNRACKVASGACQMSWRLALVAKFSAHAFSRDFVQDLDDVTGTDYQKSNPASHGDAGLFIGPIRGVRRL